VNISLIIFPGLLTFYRHTDKIKNSIIPLSILEIFPYILLAYIDNVNLLIPIFSFIALSVFYEVGYAWNDGISYKHGIGESKRNTLDSRYFKAFIFIRFFYSIIILLIIYHYFNNLFFIFLLLMIVLIVTFGIHNSIKDNNYKIGTFIVLNFIKIYIRLIFITSTSILYLFSIFPHFIFKIIHYLDHKKIIVFNNSKYQNIINPISLSWIIILIVIDYKLLFFSSIYLFNNLKRGLYQKFNHFK
jgi:hypothetical protein